MDESAIQRFILRRCLRNEPSYLISATYRICYLEKFSAWNKFSSRTHTSTTSSVLIGCSGFAYIEAKPLHLIGPVGFADRVERKLQAYTLNLLDAESVDFIIVAAEFSGDGFDRVCEFRACEASALCSITASHAWLSFSRRSCG